MLLSYLRWLSFSCVSPRHGALRILYVYDLCTICDAWSRVCCENCGRRSLTCKTKTMVRVVMESAMARLLSCKTQTWRQYFRGCICWLVLRSIRVSCIRFKFALALLSLIRQASVNKASNNVCEPVCFHCD